MTIDPNVVRPTQLHCPACGSEELTLVETTVGTGYLTEQGITREYDGTIDHDIVDTKQEHTDTTGVMCSGCMWSHDGDDWPDQLSDAAPHPATLAFLRDMAYQIATVAHQTTLPDPWPAWVPARLVRDHEPALPMLPKARLRQGELVLVATPPARPAGVALVVEDGAVALRPALTPALSLAHGLVGHVEYDALVLAQLIDPDDDWADDDADWTVDALTVDRRHVEDLIHLFYALPTPTLMLLQYLMVTTGRGRTPACWAVGRTLSHRHGTAKAPSWARYQADHRAPKRVTISPRPAVTGD